MVKRKSDDYKEPTQDPTPPSGEVVNEEYPTASILMRFSNKSSVNITELKQKQRDARHEVVNQAKALSEAVKKESKRSANLRKARESKNKESST